MNDGDIGVIPHIICKPPEWYSTHCSVCGKVVATRSGFKNEPAECIIEYSDGSEKQVLICGECLKKYNIEKVEK